MRRLIFLVCLIFSFVSFAGAQDDSFVAGIDALLQDSESLATILSQKTINYQQYDDWYNSFKLRAEVFRKDFSQTYRQMNSFSRVQAALDGFSLAWGALKQADYAAAQYQDFITTGDVGYAHKWKEQAQRQRKEALEKIDEAFAALKEARTLAESGA
ncbi:MAG: hypothetical protein ABH865_05980 [Candidatus Omnitrophota bacterium]